MHKQNMTLKYNFLSLYELIINLDRISRFKLPEESFMRVFSDIITKHLISPQYSKKEILDLDAEYITKIVEEIWNNSVKNIFHIKNDKHIINSTLKLLITNSFQNIDEKTKIFINNQLDFSQILESLDYKTSPINLRFLIKVNEEREVNSLSIKHLKELREKYELLFPIEKLLIVEGITEEILLPVFANKLKKNFNKQGIYIIGAGGKSKSPSLYLKIKNRLKIPVILLFDSDACEICSNMNNFIENKDKILIIKEGEFEDILSINLIKRTLNKEYEPATLLSTEELNNKHKMCENIQNFYQTRHLGEYKKSKFAKIIADNIKYETDITEEIKNIIFNIA